jgi:hypothetical protein
MIRPLAAAIFLAAMPATASTPAAWTAMYKAAERACTASAGLRTPTVSAPVDFSDDVGRTALLVRGTYPQHFMKGATGTFLCLYDRRTKRAEAHEAPGFALDRTRRPKTK